MQSKADILQIFGGIKPFFFRIERLVFRFNQLVKIRENWKICRLHRVPIRVVGYPEFLVELYQKQLDCVDFAVGKILVAAEEVAQKADMLRQLGLKSERFRDIFIIRAKRGIDSGVTPLIAP